MQNNDFHCFEWLCIVFVWFAWFWLICIVFYDLHGFHTCSWYFNYFLIFYWEIMQILCATLTIVFFLSTITPTLKLHIWVQTWPGLTCGDLRGPAGTGRDLLGSEIILGKISSGSSLVCQLQLPYLFLVLLLQKYEITIPTTKNTYFRLNVMNTTLFHLARYFLWTITVQHFKTVNCNDKHFCFFNPQKNWKMTTSYVFWGFLVRRHAFMCKVIKKNNELQW